MFALGPGPLHVLAFWGSIVADLWFMTEVPALAARLHAASGKPWKVK